MEIKKIEEEDKKAKKEIQSRSFNVKELIKILDEAFFKCLKTLAKCENHINNPQHADDNI